MTYFEAGFLKYAFEAGLSSNEAAQLVKHASAHPEIEGLFKNLKGQQAEETTPESASTLSDLMLQELVHQHMMEGRKSLLPQ
jgi:hypothetical protein